MTREAQILQFYRYKEGILRGQGLFPTEATSICQRAEAMFMNLAADIPINLSPYVEVGATTSELVGLHDDCLPSAERDPAVCPQSSRGSVQCQCPECDRNYSRVTEPTSNHWPAVLRGHRDDTDDRSDQPPVPLAVEIVILPG